MDDSKALLLLELSISTINLLLPEPLTLGTPSISCGQPALLEYTGLIRVANLLDGFICLSFSESAVDYMVGTSVAPGSSITRHDRERLVEELTSHLALNASKKMGDKVKVSVPVSRDPSQKIEAKMPYLRFIVPLGLGPHSGLILFAFKTIPHGDN